MATFKPDPRIEAARYLAEAVTGVKASDLFPQRDDKLIEATYAHAMRMHTTCGCERNVRLTAARDVLLGIPPAARGELRLL